ncbi:hypothetical protein FRC03_005488 [Tulasnella sp. 419]|nr:hypothetical protein FRC03_005488 [Tulasnella sp. 419]
MAEPLEETRSELIFATEQLLSSLSLAIPMSDSKSSSAAVELDEIEIQKGILQLAKGLSFLHTSARLVHSNLTPDAVLINAAGDWKLGGLGLAIPLLGPDGNPTRWEFPTFDSRSPSYTQRSFDYIAPEYALDEQISISSDFYSLGCVIYAVHAKGLPPFRNRGNLGTMRSNVGRLEGGGGLRGMESWDQDLQSLVAGLITPKSFTRLSSQTLPSHSYFSSLAISTLNFLDRSNFASKTREEKIAFMKGLNSVLGRFSEGMKRRKILPSLLEEMKDPLLLSSILPNVFNIAANLDPDQFQMLVLPSLKPLFTVKDPPINMMVLLENLETIQTKTSKPVFRTEVLPLVYHALESDHATVQEKALSTIPGLCDTIDYAEVQGIMFPRVALVFTKTRILSVKVATLECFISMVKTLDQTSLTQKLVPLLSKIRTKEPAVMMACLSVQEAMGLKVDREAVATLVLPQLWTMSVGPLLNIEQFTRFMNVIKILGERIEREHSQYLRDSQRIEDRSASLASSTPNVGAGTVDFESLVGGATKSPAANSSTSTNGASTNGWEDDVWGSILGDNSPKPGSTPRTQSPAPNPKPLVTPRSSSALSSARTLGAKPVPASSFNSSAFSAPSTPSPLSPPPNPTRQTVPSTSSMFVTQSQSVSGAFGLAGGVMPALSPTTPSLRPSPAVTLQATQASKPNYDFVMAPVAPSTISSSSMPPPLSSTSSFGMMPTLQPSNLMSNPLMTPNSVSTPLGMSNILAPNKPSTPSWGQGTQKSKNNAWGDFDPLA